MQLYGFVRIYDSKVGSVSRSTVYWDWLLCLCAFVTPQLLRPEQLQPAWTLVFRRRTVGVFFSGGRIAMVSVSVHRCRAGWIYGEFRNPAAYWTETQPVETADADKRHWNLVVCDAGHRQSADWCCPVRYLS